MSQPIVNATFRPEEIAEYEVMFEDGELALRGDLAVPRDACGLIVVPCACRLPRRLPYNKAATIALNRRGFATLLLDCLTPAEKCSISPPVRTSALADRLSMATERVRTRPEVAALPVGYLATDVPASTVVLLAADRVGEAVDAVVSVGIPGETEIAHVGQLRAPILLISSGTPHDQESAGGTLHRLGNGVQLDVIPGATTLGSGDPGPHKRAFSRACDWFARHLHVDDPAVERARESQPVRGRVLPAPRRSYRSASVRRARPAPAHR